jgi:hypothetical protein
MKNTLKPLELVSAAETARRLRVGAVWLHRRIHAGMILPDARVGNTFAFRLRRIRFAERKLHRLEVMAGAVS